MPSDALTKEFQAIVGKENVLESEADRHSYSYDSAVLDPVVPELAVRPTTSEELGKVVRLCNQHGLPLTPRGSGTNLSGGTIPAQGGIVLLTNALNKIVEINEEDLYAVVQPGVVTATFANEVAKRGLFYPPDPGSQAVSTLGGNVAENAGGLRGLKYGVTKDYVMGVDFFDVNGELVKSGSRTVKCVTGLNLSALQVASEGTMGVFNEIILKLVPPPAANKAMMAIFDDIDKASETVASIIAHHIVPCTLELLDNATINYVEDFTKAGLPTSAQAILLIEVDGHAAQVAEEAEKVVELCKKAGAVEVKAAKDEAERNKLWEARRAALPALARAKPTTVLEDATVPRSQIPAMIRAINEIGKKYRLDIGTFGHAGDGNLHPTILCDKRDKEEFHRVEEAVDEIFDVALSLKGTLSGEHGIGLAKSKWLEKETSPATIAYAKALKAAIDPKGILNPGKIIGG
ncbi:FAD-binding oxidoreductase [Desulfovibrio ferrophilus]|uniref:Glycolate oxidase, subunit GlcD n=1 Tax=Desulfovibrio ferrophilus TaxID=241368 RepID=A0A2Z6B3D4_9BACT|nr:FAD-linked oxidase C-terminal domain-containing protein [Desulfovibrio ferrophilus]BBD10017.1 glycolate oxidase, subunit GlcD [Desulfovibrio ferrophilus]